MFKKTNDNGDINILEEKTCGLVLFETSKKAKHLSISIRPPAKIRVAIPIGVSFKEANIFFLSKLNWVDKNLKKLKLRSQYINYNNITNLENAKNHLLKRLEELAKKHNFSYNKVSIRNQKTRWGSCSSKNNISLNIQLIKLPEDLIDYVIIHELVHTVIKNHSQLFWFKMKDYFSDVRKLDKRLKNYYLA